MDSIKIVGAREHNLKNISVSLPKNKLVVITGPSGSGKSSLALDIIYVEGKQNSENSQRNYNSSWYNKQTLTANIDTANKKQG